LTYEGSCDGVLLENPRGANGFGYDPIFFFPEFDKTFAEIPREEKNRVSHRGKALRELRDEFDKVIKWITQQIPVEEKFSGKE
jgi:XTP/dITP diphosphohydrolase